MIRLVLPFGDTLEMAMTIWTPKTLFTSPRTKLRQTQTRVCPRKLLQYIVGQKKDLKHGSEDAVEFWGVPIENFPNGLPSDIEDCRMTEEDMEKYELLGDTKCDMERYYIIDKQAKRHVLGKEVHSFKFFLRVVKLCFKLL